MFSECGNMTENFNKKRVVSRYLSTLASRVLDYLSPETGSIKKVKNARKVITRIRKNML